MAHDTATASFRLLFGGRIVDGSRHEQRRQRADGGLRPHARAAARAARRARLRRARDPALRRGVRARGALPARADREARAARLHGADDPRGLRGLLQRRDHLRDHLRGAGARRLGGGLGRLGRELAVRELDPALGQRGAEAALAAADRARRDPLLGVPHRARRRHRPREHAHDRHAPWTAASASPAARSSSRTPRTRGSSSWWRPSIAPRNTRA